MTSILTIAVMSLVVALTLSIVSSKYGTTFQASSWQESLQGAEAGVDIAMAALNTGDWTGWSTQNGTPPRGTPSGGSAAGGNPDSTHYNYIYPPALTHVGEGNNSVAICVTVDTGGLPLDQNGNQWFRIRSAGTTDVPGPARASSEKLDNRIRKVSLVTDRVSGAPVSGGKPRVSRYIEVVAQPIGSNLWARGITLKNQLTMSGGSYIDSFDSSDPFKSTNRQYDQTKRQAHGDIGILDSTGSDLQNLGVWGSLSYSGPPVKNTGGVTGTISTPYSATVNSVSDPVWTPDTSYVGGGVPNGGILTAGTKSNPRYYKINGDLQVAGGQSLHIVQQDTTADNTIYIWITGKLATSGSGLITQDANVKVIYYVDGDMEFSGSSFNNQYGVATGLQIFGVTPANGTTRQLTISGGGNFIAAVNAPAYIVKISGSASYSGALIGKSIDLSGSGGFHYDAALAKNGGPGASNYAFASWFEDVR
jgi:hypothetical protein